LAQLLQLFINLGPILREIQKYLGQRIRKRRLQLRVVIQLHIQVVAHRVLNRRRPALDPVVLLDLFLKVFIQNRNRFDLHVNPLRHQILIRNLAQLGRYALHAETLITKMLGRQFIDRHQCVEVTHVV